MSESLVDLPDATATRALGARLVRELRVGEWVALIGSLGAGKTTLVRGALESLGYSGVVRSPSFALIALYETQPQVAHLDLYRVGEPNELEVREALEGRIGFVEWPESAPWLLEESALEVWLDWHGEGRRARIVDRRVR